MSLIWCHFLWTLYFVEENRQDHYWNNGQIWLPGFKINIFMQKVSLVILQIQISNQLKVIKYATLDYNFGWYWVNSNIFWPVEWELDPFHYLSIIKCIDQSLSLLCTHYSVEVTSPTNCFTQKTKMILYNFIS